MNGHDFDSFARTVATTKSRRRMLTLVLGGAASGMAALAGVGTASARTGCGGRAPCPEGQECVAGRCVCPGNDCDAPGVFCGGQCVTCATGQLLDPATCTCVECPPVGCTQPGQSVCAFDVCCDSPQVCGFGGTECCTPMTPDQCPAFIECGPMHDPCTGGDVDCGSCGPGQVCSSGRCVADCSSCDFGAACTLPFGGTGTLQCVDGACICVA